MSAETSPITEAGDVPAIEAELAKAQAEIKQLKKLLHEEGRVGLVWAPQHEDTLEKAERHFPILHEEPELHQGDGETTHLLIEGDNYQSLLGLNCTHKGRVDLIYIDPPYNTGNDKEFRYNDRFVGGDDPYRHSKWLSFMHTRLQLAKTLLTESGVIFVSIGTDEQAHLRLLMDRVFNESNFVACITRLTKAGSNKGTHFAPSIDYILVYARSLVNLQPFAITPSQDYIKKFKDDDGDGRKYLIKGLYQSSLDPMRGCSNQRYYIKCPDGTLCIPPGNVFPEIAQDACKVAPLDGEDKVWRWSDTSYLRERDNLVFKKTKTSPLVDENGQQSRWNVYTKQYLDESLEKGTLPRDFLDIQNSKGTADLKALGMHGSFAFPKPVELIEHLLQIVQDKNAVVLDFFAGSGTTGQAVLELNREDGGNRRFILCTNDENGICREVCYERIRRLLTGYRGKDKEKAPPLLGALRFFTADKAFIEHSEYPDDMKLAFRDRCFDTLRMREECYDEVLRDPAFALFERSDALLAVLLETRQRERLFTEVKRAAKGRQVLLYAFSFAPTLDAAPYREALGEVELRSIPTELLNTYERLFRRRLAGEWI